MLFDVSLFVAKKRCSSLIAKRQTRSSAFNVQCLGIFDKNSTTISMGHILLSVGCTFVSSPKWGVWVQLPNDEHIGVRSTFEKWWSSLSDVQTKSYQS